MYVDDYPLIQRRFFFFLGESDPPDMGSKAKIDGSRNKKKIMTDKPYVWSMYLIAIKEISSEHSIDLSDLSIKIHLDLFYFK